MTESQIPLNVLVSDGDTTLSLVPVERVHLGPTTFGFSMADGGGFSGMFVTVEAWKDMRDKVDAYVAKITDAQLGDDEPAFPCNSLSIPEGQRGLTKREYARIHLLAAKGGSVAFVESLVEELFPKVK